MTRNLGPPTSFYKYNNYSENLGPRKKHVGPAK